MLFVFSAETSILKTMKNFFFILLMFVSPVIFGQTDSLEIAALLNKLIYNQIDNAGFAKIKSDWDQKIKAKGYPNQPVDRNGQVHYAFIDEFSGFDKEYLFNRTLEWLSINYGIIPSSIYSNINDGKIIYRTNLNLFDNYSCVPTTIISIKNGKIRIEQISIAYQAYYGGDYSAGIPESVVTLNVYPVILKKYNEWNTDLALLSETARIFSREEQNLKDYILSYGSSDSF